MSDDWLKATGSGHSTEQPFSSPQFASRDVEVPHRNNNSTADVDEEDHMMNLNHENIHHPSSSSCCPRRRMILVVALVVVIGAAIGVSVALTGGNTGSSSSSNSNNNEVSAPSPLYSPGGAPTVSPGPTSSNAYEIADIIDSVARFGGQEFDNPQSYQSLAKKWVLTQDFPVADGSSLSTEQQAVQLYALACIYFSTYSVRSAWTDFHYGADVAIPAWFSSLGWLGSAAGVCNWYGLTCNEQGRVAKIELDTNGLTGSFPPETAYLHESLQTIDLYNNILHNSGDEGNSWMGELTNLEFLFFGTTSFEYDGVPTVLGKLTKLQELDFSYTLYFGDLPGEVFTNLSNLKYLVMDGNAYNTSLPAELVQLPSLEYLYAGFNFLEGNLDFISQMPKIFELWMDDNPGLGGTIPTSIGSATQLASLSITNCGLTGTIPTEIGAMADMIQMWLYDNQLVGTIPTEIGNLVTMKILNLQKNGVRAYCSID